MADKILVIEDAPRVMQLVRAVLEGVGYQVIAASQGAQGLEMVALEQPHLVLLDILLPGELDGYQVCRRIREFSDVGVIMLTAKAQDHDILAGFDAGADDYLTKPFNAQELVARVQAVLKRTRHIEERQVKPILCGEIEIDLARRTVKRNGQPVALTGTEYALLRELALHINCTIPHEDLLTRVWGFEYRNDVDYLRAYVRYLRRKLEPDPHNPRYILTSPGVGYMLAHPSSED